MHFKISFLNILTRSHSHSTDRCVLFTAFTLMDEAHTHISESLVYLKLVRPKLETGKQPVWI